MSQSLVSPGVRKILVSICQFLIFVIVFNSLIGAVKSAGPKTKKPKCALCRDMVDNFIKGLRKTAKGNFGGGNTDWEDRKLGNYLFSETRFEEILEGTCQSDSECHHLLEQQEDNLLEWFKNKQADIESNLFASICIVKAKSCCGENQFGPQCKPCALNWGHVCSGNGRCEGSGTRTGSGKCLCNFGFTGDMCDQCGSGFYESERNETALKCNECHRSCDKCSGPEASDCEKCKNGWLLNEESKICEDINECLVNEDACRANEYCENTEGSHTCYECDPACKTSCGGRGADKCQGECNSGYRALPPSNPTDFTNCIDINECEESKTPVCGDKLKCVNKIGGYDCVAPEYETDFSNDSDSSEKEDEDDDQQVEADTEPEPTPLRLNPANLKIDL